MRRTHKLLSQSHIPARPHAMNALVITDIGKEATIARLESPDDETQPTFGREFAPYGRRSPLVATPRRSRPRPPVGPPPLWDFLAEFVSPAQEKDANGLRGLWRVARFPLNRRVRPRRPSDQSRTTDCNLHSSRAQFGKGANRVFYKEIDAT